MRSAAEELRQQMNAVRKEVMHEGMGWTEGMWSVGLIKSDGVFVKRDRER